MLEETFKQKLKRLPNHIADFLCSVEAVNVIIEIVKKNKFERPELKELNSIIYGVVFKEIAIEKIRDEIKKKLSSNEEESKEITLMILVKIFFPIKDSLLLLYLNL